MISPRELANLARLKLKTLRELSDTDLAEKLAELRMDLNKIRAEKTKGTLKKKSGDMKWVRRDIARMMTMINERKQKANAN